MKKIAFKTVQILLLFLIIACAQVKEDTRIKEFQSFTFPDSEITIKSILELEQSSENFKSGIYIFELKDSFHDVYFLELEKTNGYIFPIRYGVNGTQYINWESFSLRICTIYKNNKNF